MTSAMFLFHYPNGLQNLTETTPLPELFQYFLPLLSTSFATSVILSVCLLSFFILYRFTGLLASLLCLLCMFFYMSNSSMLCSRCLHREATSCDTMDESRDERMEQPSPQPRRSQRLLRQYEAAVPGRKKCDSDETVGISMRLNVSSTNITRWKGFAGRAVKTT